jgi:hypothetical protein
VESHPYFTNAEDLERRKSKSFEDRKSNVFKLKSSLSSHLDWVITFVPNFSSSNLLDLVNFLDFLPQ